MCGLWRQSYFMCVCSILYRDFLECQKPKKERREEGRGEWEEEGGREEKEGERQAEKEQRNKKEN